MTTQPDDPERRPTDLVRSVSRALAVLEAVSSHGGPVSAKAVARRTGLNLSTTYHLLRTLCWEGYLVRLPSGDYRVGGGVARRYRELTASLGAPPAVRAVLEGLSMRTGLTGVLGRVIDGQPAITDLVEGCGSPRVERLAPGFDSVVLDTPLGQLLAGPGSGPEPIVPRVVIEDGRLAPDVSCAAVAVRRRATAEGAAVTWGICLVGRRGSFAGVPAALHALVQASQRLAGLRGVQRGEAVPRGEGGV